MTPCNDCLFCYIEKPSRTQHDRDRLFNIVDDLSKLTDRAVAEKYRVCAKTVSKLRALAGVPSPPPRLATVDPKRLAKAKQMLDDGVSYQEVSRTLKMGGNTLRKYFPGYTYTPQQVAERAAIGRMEARIFATTNPIHARR